MAYSILKSEYPGCFFQRLTDHCTVILSKDGKVKTGWSYSTCLYVLYGNVLYINPRYYSNTTAHHRTRLLRAIDIPEDVIDLPIGTLAGTLAEDLLIYGKLSNWSLYSLAERSKYKAVYIANLENQIKAKDKQIAKLTKQLERRSRWLTK